MPEILTGLKNTRNETLKYFALDEASLSKTYAPGKWTIRQILHHLADAEAVLCERIKRGIAETGTVVYSFDQDAWAKNLHYPEMPLPLSQALYTSVREQVIYLAEKYYTSEGSKNFFQAGVGLRTVKDEFDKVVWHNEKHLVQLKQALKGSIR